MKKKHLLTTAAAGIFYLTLSSFGGGTYSGIGNHTGTAGTTNTCGKSGCHTGASSTTGSIEFRLKSNGASSQPVTYFESGKEYIVTLKGLNATSSLTHFGFQLFATDMSNNPVGTFSNAPAMTKTAASNAVLEHSSRIAKTGGIYEVSADWTAPTTVSGGITFNAIVNAVNGNSNPMGDDVSGPITLSLNNKTSVGTVNYTTVFKAYPNPVQGVLTLDMTKAATGDYSINVINANGAIVATQNAHISSASYSTTINSSSWATGMYFVHISKDGNKRVIPVMKQ